MSFKAIVPFARQDGTVPHLRAVMPRSRTGRRAVTLWRWVSFSRSARQQMNFFRLFSGGMALAGIFAALVRMAVPKTAWMVVCTAAVFASCTAVGKQYTEEQTPPVEVAQLPTRLDDRARAYWEARVNGDLVTTFDYEAVNVKGVVSLSQYVRSRSRIVYKRAKVLNTEVVGKDRAVANLVVEAVVPGLPGTFTSEFEDEWVFIDGLWYHGGDRS